MNCHSLPKKIILILLVLLLGTSFVFASEEYLPSSEAPSFDLVIPEEYLDPVYDKLASESGGSRAVYTVTDVYNLLAQQFGLSTDSVSSAYIWSRMAGYLKILGLNINGSNSQYAMSLRDIIAQQFPSASVSNTQYGLAYYLGNGSFITSAEMQFVISNTLSRHFSGTNGNYIDVNLANIESYINTIRTTLANTTNTKLDNIYSVLESSWTPFNITYNGWSNSLDGNYDTSTNPSNGYNKTVYFKFTNSSGANTYRFSRLLLNMINTGISDSSHVTVYAPVGNSMFEFPADTAYLMGRYVYLTDLPNNFATNQSFILKIDFDYVSFTSTKNLTAEYIPDSIYSLLSNAEFDLRLINREFSSINSNLSTLTDYFVDPDKVAAEQASQDVIDDTLDGFTGSGSAAAKTSDTGSMKNASSGLRQGLDTGAGVSNAMSVFTNSNFWGWFTQSNSNQINNIYPAPDVNSLFNSRAPGDYIPDFLSNNENQLHDLLGGSEW